MAQLLLLVLLAQWVHYPTPDAPRKADGSLDLTAPAPRLPNGNPDFSGIWHTARRNPCTPESGRFIPCGSKSEARRLHAILVWICPAATRRINHGRPSS